MTEISEIKPKATHNWVAFAFIFVLCIASRLLTSIYFIEDPDSLRFAMGVQEYDVAHLRPHFPGYPLFCWATSLVTLISGSFGVAFAIMGGLALFGVIFFTLKIAESLKLPANPWVLAALVFVNPLIWIMSNRYMPDLAGLAILLAAFWVFLRVYQQPSEGAGKGMLLFFALAGILPGVRLSYLPLLLVPVIAVCVKHWRKSWTTVAGVLGVAVWLVPMIWVTGWNELLAAAQEHTQGHFGEWGGTAATDPNYGARFLMMLETTWADGLGGWMPGRNGITLVLTGALLIAVVQLGRMALSWVRESRRTYQAEKWWNWPHMQVWICVGTSLLVYAMWIFFYQNVLYKSRHILPFLPFLLLGIGSLFPGKQLGPSAQKSRAVGFGILFAVLIPTIFIGTQLAIQHKTPSAIAQSKTYLNASAEEGAYFYSVPLINYYLENQGGTALVYRDIEAQGEELTRLFEAGHPIWSNRKLDGRLGQAPVTQKTFYHNPYVNRLWPVITLYHYQNPTPRP